VVEEGESEEVVRLRRALWLTSIALSGLLIVVLGLLWNGKNNDEFNVDELTTVEKVANFLGEDDERAELPTGVFIQSLRFVSSSDVHITGYIWQRWSAELTGKFKQGAILPELVDSSVELREDYRVRDGDVEVIGWYFEGLFRQPFEYDDYPFDHKQVWIRIWPKDFAENLVLTPDFGAYPGGTGLDDTFGIDASIVLGEWRTDDTYFDYQVTDYNTNFGIPNYVGQEAFPELRFNVLVRRQFQNAFLVNLVPLLVVAALAFGAVLTVTRQEELSARFGYNVSGVIATISALFFVVLLAHIQLRQEFPGAGVVYLEYFYFLMYLVLMAVGINAFLVSTRGANSGWLSELGDNMVMKLAYWPGILATVVVVTAVSF
jgi:hypothetical protein